MVTEIACLFLVICEPVPEYLILKYLEGNGKTLLELASLEELNKQLNEVVSADLVGLLALPAFVDEVLNLMGLVSFLKDSGESKREFLLLCHVSVLREWWFLSTLDLLSTCCLLLTYLTKLVISKNKILILALFAVFYLI